MKIPDIHKLSKASQLSLLAIVILIGAVFFTVTSALQTQNSSSHASGSVVYQNGNYYCSYVGLAIRCVTPTPIKQAPTPTPTPKKTNCIVRPTCYPGVACPQYIGVVYCPPATPTPTARPLPTATKAPVPTATKAPIPTITLSPTSTIVPTVKPTPTNGSGPTATAAPTAKPLPTATPVPGDTTISLVVGLHGIGTAGDSANPGSDGNMSPLHSQRNITVFVFNSQNQQVADQQGTVTYDSATGLFDGNVDLGSQLATGLYTVKVQTSQYLRGLVPGIQSLTQGQTTTLSKVVLVVGDINGDNQINILDYNILMGCYSDLLPAVSCTAENNTLSDLNDDGAVNQFDYNIFLRELSNLSGN